MKKQISIFLLILLSSVCVKAQYPLQMLGSTIQNINRDCPMKIDDDMILTRVLNTKPYVIFETTVSEAEIDIPTAGKHKKELKKIYEKMLEEMAKKDDFASLLYLIAANDKGLRFRLIGNKTNKSLDIVFDQYELAPLVNL